MQIAPELSAIASPRPARSIAKAAALLATDDDVVADVGCGYTQGTRELMRHHGMTYAVDTRRQRERIKERLDALEGDPLFGGFKTADQFAKSRLRLNGAYVINVLHVLPAVTDRVAVLRTAVRNLRSDGFVVIDVPSYEHYYSTRMTPENAFGDGYVFRRPGRKEWTFYRLSQADDIDAWATAAGLGFDQRVVDNHHLVRIYRPDAGRS